MPSRFVHPPARSTRPPAPLAHLPTALPDPTRPCPPPAACGIRGCVVGRFSNVRTFACMCVPMYTSHFTATRRHRFSDPVHCDKIEAQGSETRSGTGQTGAGRGWAGLDKRNRAAIRRCVWPTHLFLINHGLADPPLAGNRGRSWCVRFHTFTAVDVPGVVDLGHFEGDTGVIFSFGGLVICWANYRSGALIFTVSLSRHAQDMIV